MDHRYYVGPLGSLHPLPDILGDVDASLVRAGGIHTSLGGARTVDSFGYKRSWTWAWDNATAAQVPYVEALHYGLVPGPLRLLDPRRANRLPEQVASGGSLRRSSRGFAATGGAITYRALRSIAPDLATLPAAPVLRGAVEWAMTGGAQTLFPTGRGTDDVWRVPVLPGEPLELSVWAAGATGIVAALEWREYTATGGISVHQAAATSLLPGQWQKLATITTPTPGTAAVGLCIATQGGAPAGSVLTTAWQVAALGVDLLPPGTFSCAGTDPDIAGGWRPGGGGPYVVADVGRHTYGLQGLHGLGLTLLET